MSMFSFLARGFASLSLALKQPLTAFCELETAHDDALITKTGHYLSWIRIDGMQPGTKEDWLFLLLAVRRSCRILEPMSAAQVPEEKGGRHAVRG